MSEAAAPAAAPEPTSNEAPATESVAQQEPSGEGASPPPPNMTAEPSEGGGEPEQSVEDIFDLENLGDLGGKKFRLKHGDQEHVVDTAEVLRLAQVGRAGYEAFRRAAEREKAVVAREQQMQARMERLESALQTDLLGTIRKLGLEDALYSDIERELQYQQLPEHERARVDLDRQRQQIERERQAWLQQQEQARQAQQQAQIQAEAERYQQDYLRSYNAALDAAGVPADPALREEAIPLMARMHEQALAGNVDVPVEVLAGKVRERFERLGVSFVRAAPPEKLPEILGDKFRAAQQADVKRVQQARAPNGQFAPQQAAPKGGGQDKTRARFGSLRDFQRALDSKK